MAASKKYRRTSYLIKRLEIATRAMLESALSGRGVTLAQYTLLSMVSDVDGMSSADVARRSNVSKQATNEIINVLERKGFIGRSEDDENRRILRIKLTRKGRTLLNACDRAVDRNERTFLAAIPATLLATFRRTIENLIP
jgi:DNA-binding MarR family transcriptional regulator